MSFKKIVYIRCAPLSKLIFESVFIQELLDKGFDVEYIDTTLLHSKGFETNDFSGFKGIIKIKTIKEFKQYLIKQNNSETLFIDLVRFSSKSIGIFRLLKKHDFKLGFFARYAVTTVSVKTSLKQKLSGIQVKLKNRIGMKCAYLLKKAGLLKTYDYIFTGGKKAVDFFFNNSFYDADRKNAQIIQVNANDYDRFLNHKLKLEKPIESYIVFLDQYIPYHPDFIILKKKSLTAESYYKDLNKKFSEIESAFKTKIIIAAHPKAISYLKKNPFEGRKIIFDKTIDLVANCKLVLAHYSTSINYAILYEKPIIFLLNYEFKEILPVPTQMIQEMSTMINCPITYLEEIFNEQALKTDSEKYVQYKYNFMTSPESEKRLTIKIFTDFLLNTIY